MKRIFLLLLLGIFSSCANLGNPAFKQAAQSPPPSSGGGSEPSDILPLKIYILNVGQGDSTLIITPRGRTVLIDGGKPGKGREVILPFLESEGIGHLDAIVATHYDADHIGGIPEVIAGKDGELDTADDLRPTLGVFDRGGNPLDAAPAYSPYLQAVSPYRKTLQPGDLLPLDSGLVVRCVAANGSILNGAVFDLFQEKIFEAENSSSVALLVEYKNFRYLTAGDLTGGGSPGGFPTLDLEGELAQKVGPVSAVHVNHHGSASSSSSPASFRFFSLRWRSSAWETITNTITLPRKCSSDGISRGPSSGSPKKGAEGSSRGKTSSKAQLSLQPKETA